MRDKTKPKNLGPSRSRAMWAAEQDAMDEERLLSSNDVTPTEAAAMWLPPDIPVDKFCRDELRFGWRRRSLARRKRQ